MPAQREGAVGLPEESSTSMCKLASFYRKYRIEFHISGMVFCLIGGKVGRFFLSVFPFMFEPRREYRAVRGVWLPAVGDVDRAKPFLPRSMVERE